MGKESKVGSITKSPAQAAKKKTKETQKVLFIEAARSIGVDETGKNFEAGIKKINPPKN